MAKPGGVTTKVHPSKRHNNPMFYKSGKPRLRPLNCKQLNELLAKTNVKKMAAKIQRELSKRYSRGNVAIVG